jgi:threonine/homoserine/homoserine lactone efflux protein
VHAPDAAPALAAMGIGVGLAAAPGPVQAVLLAESVRGGPGRGFRALAGAHATFAALLLALAAGLSVATPRGAALRALEVAGGLLLVWLAVDGMRSPSGDGHGFGDGGSRRALPPSGRGALAIVLNPGGWIFLGAVASPLLARATARGGTSGAIVAALALVAGAAAGDACLVALGGVAVRRAREPARARVRIALAVLLAGLGVWLFVTGVR